MPVTGHRQKPSSVRESKGMGPDDAIDISQENSMAYSASIPPEFKSDFFRNDLVAWLRVRNDPAAWTGLSAVTWTQTFDPDLATALLESGFQELGQRLSRQQLQSFCARSEVPIRFRIAAVMAWGRSNSRNTSNNRNLWASVPNIEPLIGRLAQLTRRQAFGEFSRLVGTGDLQGMRASFFTKLMFFFGCPGAYILDQWMAKAVLALLAANWGADADGKPVFHRASGNFVRLGSGGTSIHLAMSSNDYERYCSAVEALIEPLARQDGADVERWLFSDPRSEWRKFLKSLDWTRAAHTVGSAV